mmetsp:Transcript_15051/g.19915  ORF Transcript_15051/g.19915 Transcript_15051/m.19915 type:complete len:115 (+) Transcript_15051:195-539(+)
MGQQPSSNTDLRAAVAAEIKENPVVVYSKSYCPHCSKTKATLQSKGVAAKVIELDVVNQGSAIQNELYEMTKQRTVPNTFIGGKHLGGNDTLQAHARSGQLKILLDQAGVPNSF